MPEDSTHFDLTEEGEERREEEEEAQDDSFEPTLAISLSNHSKKIGNGTVEEHEKEKHHSEAEVEQEEEFTTLP